MIDDEHPYFHFIQSFEKVDTKPQLLKLGYEIAIQPLANPAKYSHQIKLLLYVIMLLHR